MRLSGIQAKQVRFGYSVARECLRAIEVLLQPAHHAEQMPWIRVARRHATRELRAQMTYFRFFFAGTVEVFPGVWSDAAMDSFEAELRALRHDAGAYRDAVARRLGGKRLVLMPELRHMRRRAWLREAAAQFAGQDPRAREMLEAFVDSPAGSLRSFCTMLEQVYARIVAPTWGAIGEVLRDDVAMRRRVLRKYGVAALLRTLAPEVAVRRTRLGAIAEFDPSDADVHLGAGASIVLAPSFFTWPHVQVFALKTPRGTKCGITYPLPPLSARNGVRDRDSLARGYAAIGDPLRLRILELLAGRNLSTRELAGYLQIAEPLVSRHLRVLRDAKLVDTRRSGYFVLYGMRRERLGEIAASVTGLARG